MSKKFLGKKTEAAKRSAGAKVTPHPANLKTTKKLKVKFTEHKLPFGLAKKKNDDLIM
jgi:hypothetical protein